MRILLVEPFFTGSHRQWAEGFQKFSRHEVILLTLPGRHWKWRMAGGAVAAADDFLKTDYQPDLILATDMLDVATFLALTRKRSAGIPVAVYFHENQITYPWSPDDTDIVLKRDHHYGFINYTSALSADAVLFNSEYHRRSFLGALPGFLKMFPDKNGLKNIEKIKAKSRVLKLGMDLAPFFPKGEKNENQVPVFLWNHRREFDKNPAEFFEALFELDAEDIDFQLIILGEDFSKTPGIFKEAEKKLGRKIIHNGYAERFEDYRKLLLRADILPVTSYQDFFGGSVVEAMAASCLPLLPNRLAYPEHIPENVRDLFIYDNKTELRDKLRHLTTNFQKLKKLIPVSDFVAPYDWGTFAKSYDTLFQKIAQKRI